MRWLWAALLCVAVALSPPRFRPVLLTPRWHAIAPAADQSGVFLLHVHRWLVELKENTAIRAPHHHDCRFYRGRVVREAGSSAAVTECAGRLYGLLQVGGDEFLLQPAQSVRYTHALRRRAAPALDVALTEYAPAFNLTDDMITDFDVDVTDYDDSTTDRFPSVRTRQADRDAAYFHDIAPVTRPLSAAHGLWLELAIVADHTMIDFHGRERMNHYILALMNIVSAIFNDPSLNSNMTLVIKKLFHYEKDNTIKSGNAKKSLESINKWNHRNLRKLPPESRWDAAVWLTRAELGGPSGLAPLGGVCSTPRSAALDRDEGLTSAFVIAHELAHLLGLTHDDSDSGCAGAARHASVMAPTVLATLHKYAWSRCSKDQFRKLSKTWTCMHYRSQDKGLELGGAKELSNYMFSMDDQCRTQFGEGYETCTMPGLRPSCARLWCAARALPSVCRSHAPPLDGTPCTHNHWCLEGECVLMPGHAGDEVPVPGEEPAGAAHAQWGAWGGWSACSARCGYGLRTRARRCRFGSESVCEGASAQAAVCWAGRECAGARDVRADICRKQSPDFIPHLHANDSKHCEIWCVERTGGDAFTFGALPDGTPCGYAHNYDVCFQGTCVKGQCNTTDPVCNWCPDDYCYNKTFVHTRQLQADWSSMLTVPHNAHKVSVHISTPTVVNLAVREMERKRVKSTIYLSDHQRRFEVHEDDIQYDPNVPQNLQVIEVDNNVIDAIEKERYGYEGEVIVAGTLLKWRQTARDINITTESRLLSDLIILGVYDHPNAFEDRVTVVVSLNYSLPLTRTRPMEYRWGVEREPCSASCGGGHRRVRSLCPRGYHCPPPYYEPCNQHRCEFEWAVGAWEECSATCGAGGLQERQFYCVPRNISSSTRMDLVLWSVSPALCKEQPPPRQQSCNRSPCTFHWQELPWTPCSASCGRGVTRQPLACPAADAALCGPRPRERTRRCRLRRCPPACRSPDLQNCALFASDELEHKCALRPFRKLCCFTCKRLERAKADRRAGG